MNRLPSARMFEQIGEGLFVVRYQKAADLAPLKQKPLVEALSARKSDSPAAIVFVLSEAVRSVDTTVPSYWLSVTSDPRNRLRGVAVVASSLAVRMAANAFGITNVLRGVKVDAKAFLTEREALSWAKDLIAPKL